MISFVRFCAVEGICTRSVSYARNQPVRQARMLDKMIKKKLTQKKLGNDVPRRLKKEVLISAYDNEGTNRKTAALNKLFMGQLVELISCGAVAGKISELGIEFSKVKLSPCHSNIYVYWTSSKSETPDSAIAEALRDLKADLQPQMGFLLPMRKAPYINFVRDLRLESQNIVEKLLDVADFGTDYMPTSAKKIVNPETNELQKVDDEENLKMRQNVLGLDHAKIKEKLMQNVKRFQHINIKKDEIEKIEEFEHSGKLAVFTKKLFHSFYKKKMYLDKKFRAREYDNSCIIFDKPYDPEEEAEQYWDLQKFKDDLIDKEEEEYENLDDDARDNDYYCKESEIDEDDEYGDELEVEKFNKKNNED